MSSELQNEANRRNARRSSGPSTEEGKSVSSKNSLKHGLLSRDLVLPDEDVEAFAQLAERVGDALDPVAELELVLADRIIGLVWRLRRLGKIEAGILAWQNFNVLNKPDKPEVLLRWVETDEDLTDRDAEAGPEHRGYRNQREEQLARSGEAFSRDSGKDALSKLSRYETSMERSLYKTLHELQRLQAVRQGKEVAVPLVVDIDVSETAIDGTSGSRKRRRRLVRN